MLNVKITKSNFSNIMIDIYMKVLKTFFDFILCHDFKLVVLSTLSMKQVKHIYEISTKSECVEKLSMIIGCNIWMLWFLILEFNWCFYDPSQILQLYKFAWTLRSSVWVVFNNFLLIDATDFSPLSFFANAPFKDMAA